MMTKSGETAERKLGVMRSVVIGLSGLFYAFAVWAAVAFAIAMAGQGVSMYGVILLIFAIAFPVGVFLLAFSFRWRCNAGQLIIVKLAGLALVAVFWMNVVGYMTLNTSIFMA